VRWLCKLFGKLWFVCRLVRLANVTNVGWQKNEKCAMGKIKNTEGLAKCVG